MNALELKREYEAKIDGLWQKRLDKIEADVAAYRQHLLDTDESYCEEARKYQAIIDEIDKVIAEEAELKKKLDMIEAGDIKLVDGPIEEPIADAEIINEPAIEDIVAPVEDVPAPVDADAPIEEPIIEKAPIEEPAPEIKPAELRRPGMASIFRR